MTLTTTHKGITIKVTARDGGRFTYRIPGYGESQGFFSGAAALEAAKADIDRDAS